MKKKKNNNNNNDNPTGAVNIVLVKGGEHTGICRGSQGCPLTFHIITRIKVAVANRVQSILAKRRKPNRCMYAYMYVRTVLYVAFCVLFLANKRKREIKTIRCFHNHRQVETPPICITSLVQSSFFPLFLPQTLSSSGRTLSLILDSVANSFSTLDIIILA